MKKRMLSLLLVLVMVLTILPAPAIAATTEGASLSVSGNSYRNKYVVITDGTSDAVYYINSSNEVQNMDGSAAAFAPGSYTIYYGPLGMQKNRNFYKGTFTVADDDTEVEARLSGSRNNWTNGTETEQYYYAESVYYNTTEFDHVDVRVAGSYVIHVGNQTYSATVSNPSVVVKVAGNQVASQKWSGTTSYEWRKTGLELTRSSRIEIELTLTLTYTDSNGDTHKLENMQITYDNVNNLDKFIDAIAICDGVAGLDFRVSVADIEEEMQYHTVSYEWKVYNTDGTYTELPAGAPGAPASSSGHEAGEEYAYDTEFVAGTSFYDYDNGLLYTFHGWDTYSHSSQFNVDSTAEGYYGLDGSAIEITADTYIYGYWTVTELEPSSAHIAIEKVFIVDGVEVSTAAAEGLWFRVDTGIDRDSDGDTTVDVDYPMIAATGEYKIPVYQYDTPFVFTEHNADVPGYTRTTTISVAGDYIVGSVVSGDSVTVTMDPVYQGENIHLGTVTYTNTYTKNVGTPVNEYPILTLIKSASDTGAAQDGVVFTLYSDETCQTAVGTFTTADSGIIQLDFSTVANVTAGTYYLKETGPLAGYKADPCVYAITLTASEPVEEFRNGEYVQVTYYTLSVAVPEGSTAVYTTSMATSVYHRLHIYNEPILGSLNLSKDIVGIANDDKSKVTAIVIVYGPITRDGEGNITDVGSTWQLDLNSGNNWAASLSELPLGEYLIHESFASVHGYTWTDVTYGSLTTVEYNGIISGVFKIESDAAIGLTLTNTYEEWTSADFYIKKVDEAGNALAGATFQLYTDAACTDEASGEFTVSATSGADGYAHFAGFKVPEGQTSVTYYLQETKAPNGYYLSSTVYKVEIKAVTNGKTTYEPKITLADGSDAGFDNVHDLLTVTNYPVLGKLTVTKAFENGTIPEGLTSVSVEVDGPNGYTRIVELNAGNSWNVTLANLALGDYTITELDANVPGYTWNVSYTGTVVSLTEENPGYTASGTISTGAATITNSYKRNEEFFENPTTLTVMKVGEDGTTPLAGAVFTLDRLDASGKNVIASASFTTGAEGRVVFDLLSGFIVEGEDIDGTYILSETAAPEGYEKTTTTWKVTIQEDDIDGDGVGEVRVDLNENKNVFENFWDWIVGGITGEGAAKWIWENDVLTVENVKKAGSLSVTKQVTDSEGRYANAEYSFTLDCSADSFDKTFTLKAGESIKVENIPWGTTYTLTENATGAAFTSVVTDSGNGKIWADETTITVTNTYTYTTHNEPLTLIKVDADDTTKVIAGAGFTLYADDKLETVVGQEVFSDENGKLELPIQAAGTYYLVETTTPAGYHPNAQAFVVNAEQKYVVKNAGTANAVTEIQMHIRVEDLAGTTSNQIDYTYNIKNTAIKPVEVSVKKLWYGADVTHPESVQVTLYRDGKAYETVSLSAANNWSYTWAKLTDEFAWTVDEPSVPSGYNKTVRSNGYSFTITNTHEDNPKTGDATDLLGLGALTAVGILGFAITAFLLLAPRKKKETER